MTQAIAILALCISLLLLVVQYINQLERRHGEITHLRSDSLIKLSLIQQRITSFRMHLETARLELRKLKDSNDKYESIEKMPHLISQTKKVEEKLKNIIEIIEAIDTTKRNTSKTLLILQSSQHEIKMLDEETNDVEKQILELIEMIASNRTDVNNGIKNGNAI
jgi:hypothetical protein